MINWSLISSEKVLETLNVNIYKGLNEEEVLKSRNENGTNILKNKNNVSLLTKLKEMFLSNYMILSYISYIFFIYNKNYKVTLALFCINIINITSYIYFINNFKGDSKSNNSTKARVLRNGIVELINIEELVVGDVLNLKKGDFIGADIRIIESEEIKVNEKNIIGEDFISEKYENKMDTIVDNLAEVKNILFRGSTVVEGNARGVVIAVGKNTELGKNLSLINEKISYKNNIEIYLKSKLKKIIIFMFIIAAILSYILILKQNDINESITLLFVPLSLIFFIPIMFIWHSIKAYFKERDIQIINPSIFINLNKIDTLLFDNVGNVCKKDMDLKGIYINEVLYEEDNFNIQEDDFENLMSILLLCNNGKFSTIDEKSTKRSIDVEILKFAACNKFYKSIYDANNRRFFEISEEWDNRIMTTVNKHKKGYRANCKGAVDKILDLSTNFIKDGIVKEVNKEYIDKIKKVDMELSKKGYSTLAVAYRNFKYLPSKSENITNNLTFVGILAFSNEIDEKCIKALSNLKCLNVEPIMICEDNKITAFAIGEKIGLVNNIGQVISGVEIENLEENEFDKVINNTKIYTRLSPKIKQKIVEALKKQNKNVAISGKNLIDMASLKLSDCAISTDDSIGIVKKSSDIQMSTNIINSFWELIHYSSEFKEKLQWIFNFLYTYILGEIIYFFVILYSGKSEYSEVFIILILNNIVLPFILMKLYKSENIYQYDVGRFKLIMNSFLSGISPVIIYMMDIRYQSVISILMFIILNFLFIVLGSKEEKANDIYYY